MKTKLLATLAVLAMAFAGVAVLTDMEQDDAAASAYAPGAYAIGTNDLRVISYVDQVLLVDTNAMAATALSNYTDFYVKIEVGTTTGTYTADSTVIGPLSLQNGKIYIDANIITTTNKFAKVSLFGYGQNLAGDALDSVTFVYTETAAELVLGVNHSDEWATVNDEDGTTVSYTDFELDSIARNGTYKADETLQIDDNSVFDGIDYGYNLKGWSKTYNGVDAIALEKTDKDDDDDKVSIEEIIFAAGAITDGKVKLFAIWEKAVYNIYVYDTTSSGYIVTDKNKNATVATGITAVASSIAPGAGYGILRIAQETAAVKNVYTVTLYKDAGTTEVEDDGTEGSYTFLNNGTYRLNVTKNDLYVKITASTAPVDITAFAFGIDKIVNDTVGKVNLSMDIYDYKVANTNEISLAGTYYKSADDSQRIYGNIKNLTLTDGTNWKAYGDLVEKSTGDGKILDGGVVALSTAYNTYDLAMILPTDTSIYAAQGFFDVDGDGVYDKNDGDMLTPWSLVSA